MSGGLPPKNVCPKCHARGAGEEIGGDGEPGAGGGKTFNRRMVCTECGAVYRACEQLHYEDREVAKRHVLELNTRWKRGHRERVREGARAYYARDIDRNRARKRELYRAERAERRRRTYEENKAFIDTVIDRAGETCRAVEGDEMAIHNTLGDLSNLMFEQLERLNGAGAEELENEIDRARAMSEVGKTIIDNSNTMLRAMQFKDGAISANAKLPRMLGAGED